MKSISKKLKSAAGASMLLALLFLFFCLSVGAVVLTAASASAGRTARNRQEQQNYLAVESAAMLLREDMEGTSFITSYEEVVKVTTTVHVKQEEGQEPKTWTTTATDISYTHSPAKPGPGELLEKVSNDFDTLYTSTKSDLNQPLPTGFTMRYPLSFEAADMPDVSGSLTVDTSGSTIYAVTAVLWVETDGKKSNFTTLVFRPSVSDASSTLREDGNPSVKTTTYTTTVTWAAPVITKGGAAS